MNKFTKIVATISDRRCDVEFLRELYAIRCECGTYEFRPSAAGRI